jgi:hypothetical protein
VYNIGNIMNLKKLSKYPESTVGFYQALGVGVYCGLIGLIMFRGNDIFGHTPNFLGPLLFLMLFCVSALICGLLTLAYPAIVFFKDKIKALKIVLFTILWLFLFIFSILIVLGLGFVVL